MPRSLLDSVPQAIPSHFQTGKFNERFHAESVEDSASLLLERFAIDVQGGADRIVGVPSQHRNDDFRLKIGKIGSPPFNLRQLPLHPSIRPVPVRGPPYAVEKFGKIPGPLKEVKSPRFKCLYHDTYFGRVAHENHG
jgi:hypothetical protein